MDKAKNKSFQAKPSSKTSKNPEHPAKPTSEQRNPDTDTKLSFIFVILIIFFCTCVIGRPFIHVIVKELGLLIPAYLIACFCLDKLATLQQSVRAQELNHSGSHGGKNDEDDEEKKPVQASEKGDAISRHAILCNENVLWYLDKEKRVIISPRNVTESLLRGGVQKPVDERCLDFETKMRKNESGGGDLTVDVHYHAYDFQKRRFGSEWRGFESIATIATFGAHAEDGKGDFDISCIEVRRNIDGTEPVSWNPSNVTLPEAVDGDGDEIPKKKQTPDSGDESNGNHGSGAGSGEHGSGGNGGAGGGAGGGGGGEKGNGDEEAPSDGQGTEETEEQETDDDEECEETGGSNTTAWSLLPVNAVVVHTRPEAFHGNLFVRFQFPAEVLRYILRGGRLDLEAIDNPALLAHLLFHLFLPAFVMSTQARSVCREHPQICFQDSGNPLSGSEDHPWIHSRRSAQNLQWNAADVLRLLCALGLQLTIDIRMHSILEVTLVWFLAPTSFQPGQADMLTISPADTSTPHCGHLPTEAGPGPPTPLRIFPEAIPGVLGDGPPEERRIRAQDVYGADAGGPPWHGEGVNEGLGVPVQCEDTSLRPPNHWDGEDTGANQDANGVAVLPVLPARMQPRHHISVHDQCQDDVEEERLRALRRENGWLRHGFLCRCCFEKDFEVHLSPCGDLLCFDCVLRIQPICPVCGQQIQHATWVQW